MFTKLINREQPAPQTQAAISMKNRLYAVNARNQHSYLGAISRFEPNQSRPTEAVKGIGAGDIHIELVPNYSDTYKFSVETTLFYLRNAFQIFGYKGGTDGLVRALRHHKYPFDVKQELVFSEIANLEAGGDNVETVTVGGQTLKAIVTYYEACWITSYRHSYGTDRSLIVESLEIDVTDVVPAFDRIDPSYDSGNGINSNGFTAWYQPISGIGSAFA